MDNYNKVPSIDARSSLDPDAAQRLRRSHLSELSGINHSKPQPPRLTCYFKVSRTLAKKLTDAVDMGLRDSHIMREAAGGRFLSSTEYNSKYIAFNNCASAPVDGSGLRKRTLWLGMAQSLMVRVHTTQTTSPSLLKGTGGNLRKRSMRICSIKRALLGRGAV